MVWSNLVVLLSILLCLDWETSGEDEEEERV